MDTARPPRPHPLAPLPFTPDIDWMSLPERPLPPGEHPKTWPSWGLPRADGRQVRLSALQQSYIYSGSLLGGMSFPWDVLQGVLRQAHGRFPTYPKPPVVIITALMSYLPQLPEGRPWRPWAEGRTGHITLPRVVSMAMLDSNQPARDASCDGSSVLVIWFQEGFGDAPHEVLERVQALDWNTLAWDWSY